MRNKYLAGVIAAVIAVCFALPAFGAPSPSKLLKQALGLSKKANKNATTALKLARHGGVAGAIGPMGPQGPQGATGGAGVTGATGLTGATGATGATGNNGKDGLNGSKGDTGDTGNNGKDGLNGSNGAKGDTGNNGKDGLNGQDGKDGSNGVKGDTGAQGNNGKSCVQDLGLDACKGNKGDTGNDGSQGPAGGQGPQGPKGDKGDKGDNGNKGDTGSQGPQGDPAQPNSISNIQIKKHTLGSAEIGSSAGTSSIGNGTSATVFKNACLNLNAHQTGNPGDFVVFNAPSGLPDGLAATSLGVTATDTETIRLCNVGAGNITLGTSDLQGWQILVINQTTP